MKSLTVHILIYPEEDIYMAHCLEFDLVAQGETTGQAFQNLLDAIELQASYTLETGEIENLIQPAPPEYWRMLARAEPYRIKSDEKKVPEFLSRIDCSVVYA